MESRQVGRGSRAGEAHSYFSQIIGWKRKLPPPLYEWKPSSPITFATAVIHFYMNHRQVEGKKVINERLREGGARDDK